MSDGVAFASLVVCSPRELARSATNAVSDAYYTCTIHAYMLICVKYMGIRAKVSLRWREELAVRPAGVDRKGPKSSVTRRKSLLNVNTGRSRQHLQRSELTSGLTVRFASSSLRQFVLSVL